VQQIKEMKIEKLIPIFFLIIACSSNEYIDNQKMIESIDSLQISKIVTEFETDSLGNILDKISIEYLKYDNENRKRFKEKIYWYKERKMSLKDYFKPDEDLFYRESLNDNGELESTFETKSNKKGKVAKAIQINKDGDRIDTTLMDYFHEFRTNGTVKKLLIKTFHEEVGELNSEIKYNEDEKPLLEVMIMDNDTMSFQTWEYSDTVLKKSIYTNYQKDTSKTVYYFGAEKMVVKEEEFDFKNGKFIKLKEISNYYDESNDRTKSIERNLETEEVKYLKYLKEK